MHFKDSKGNLLKTVEANEGDDLLAIAHEHDIDLEGMERLLRVADLMSDVSIQFLIPRKSFPILRTFTKNPLPLWSCTLTWVCAGFAPQGACEASIACSTCHVILTPEVYDKLPEPSDDENDMLDMAFGLTDTSRLGCQVQLTKGLDGMTATLPSATRNMFVDGRCFL